MVAEVRGGIVWDDQSKRFRDSSTGKFVNPDSAPSPGQYDSKQLDAIAKQLQQLAAAQERIEQRLKRRDDRERDESTWVSRKLNDISDTLNSPGANAVLTLTAVITLFTGIAVGGRLAYNGYQTLLEAIPGMQPGEVAKNQKVETWEQLFEGGSNSLVAIAIGNAEGTRTPDGGKTKAFAGHRDPGNDAPNQGTFSYQHGASSPEEADQKQIERLKGQMTQIASQLPRKDVVTWLNAADLLNQSPAAGMNFPKYLKDCNGDILCARVKSFEGDAPGITRNGLTIEEDQSRRMDQIEKAIAANQSKTSVSVTVGRVFPIPGKTHNTADFTSGYGPRSSPGGVGSTFHQGYDYAAPVGTPLVAVESGTIKLINDGGCGKGIELKMSGDRSAVYCHMDSVSVTDGQQVTAGAAVGTVGNTGNSTGPHLHIGIKQGGQYIDPGDYLKAIGLQQVAGQPGAVEAATLLITSPDKSSFWGTAVVVAPGIAVTNVHVVNQQANAGQLTATKLGQPVILTDVNGQKYNGSVGRSDPGSDLALIQFQGNIAPAPIADTTPTSGSFTQTGYPGEKRASQSGDIEGNTSCWFGLKANCIKLSVPTRPGFSGSAIVQNGMVVAIAHAWTNRDGKEIGIAIPIENLKALMDQR